MTQSPTSINHDSLINSSILPRHADYGRGADRSVPAGLLSLVSHLLIFGVLALLLTRFKNGGAEIENRSGGIVLVNASSVTTQYLSEGDLTTDASSSSSAANVAKLAELPPDLPGIESSPKSAIELGDQAIGDLIGSDSMIGSTGRRAKPGGQVTTSIFGVKGTGSRFVYVIDRSESMLSDNGRPISAAREQLIASLDSLPETSEFQIIFYNQKTKTFTPDGFVTIHFATEEMKRAAKQFVRRTRPTGGTDHLSALKAAFKFSPDVIFLLTDAEGGFTKNDLDEISRWNRSSAVINTIEFGFDRGRDRSLETVARESGGQHVFKNIRTLRLDDP